MGKKIKLAFKAVFLLVITLAIFIHGWNYLTPSHGTGSIMLQISLVFTGFGLLAYSLNINKEDGEEDIRKTLVIEFRTSAIFGIISVIIVFMYLGVSSSIGDYSKFLFYSSSISLLLCVMTFLAPVLEYNFFSD